MQEYWFCEACRSMNRADADRCYSCRAPRENSTMATVHERRLGDVLVPGVDRLDQGAAAAMRSQHAYTPVSALAYVSVALLLLSILCQVGYITILLAGLIALLSPATYELGDGATIVAGVCFVGYVLSQVLAAIVHGIFLGLTDANAPSLGGGQPRFGPVRAGAWWIEALLWTWRVDLTIWLPLYLGLRVSEVLGLLGIPIAVALVTVSLWIFGSPIDGLRKPGRLLEDLTRRLGLRGSSSGLASMWSAAWVSARLIDAIGPVLIVVGAVIAFFAAIPQMVGFQAGSESIYDLRDIATAFAVLVDLMVLCEMIANVIALALLAGITLSLADAQDTRRRWVMENAGTPFGAFRVGYPGGYAALATYPPAPIAPTDYAAPPASHVSSITPIASIVPVVPAMIAPPVAPTAPVAPAVPRPAGFTEPSASQRPVAWVPVDLLQSKSADAASQRFPGPAGTAGAPTPAADPAWQSVPQSPAGELRRPRWIRAREELEGNEAYPEPLPDEYPLYEEAAPPADAQMPDSPMPAAPIPDAPPRRVLQPSSGALPRYRVPGPAVPAAPVDAPAAPSPAVEPAAVEPPAVEPPQAAPTDAPALEPPPMDWPEGI